MEAFYTMFDGLFVSDLIGTNALSATNLMAPVLSVITFRKYRKGDGY